MKKKIILCCAVITVLIATIGAGCAAKNPDAGKSAKTGENPAPAAYEADVIEPTPSGGLGLNGQQAVDSSRLYFEYYDKMPEVRSATRYLSKNMEPVTFYSESETFIAYGLYVDENTFSALVGPYIEQMKSEGYTETMYDATRSSTHVLENGKYEIKIHTISDLSAFIADKVVSFANELKDVNIVVEVSPLK